MATFTQAQRNVRMQKLSKVQGLLSQMQAWLRTYEGYEAAGWAYTIPGTSIQKVLSNGEKTSFLGIWDTLKADLNNELGAT